MCAHTWVTELSKKADYLYLTTPNSSLCNSEEVNSLNLTLALLQIIYNKM